jgi:hypothetical protein
VRPDRAQLAEAFRFQARAAAANGSPLYTALLERAADDVAAGGAIARLVADFEGHPILAALPLRVLGAAHALALAGRAPALAAYYPSTGGRFEAEGAFRALQGVIEEHGAALRARLGANVQTNEVRRSAALLGGFLRVARATGRALRVREIGSSAGLNLLFDRYGYELGPHRFGAAGAELVLATDWQGPAPDLAAPLEVADRAGCDVEPIDVRDPEACLRLESFVWPDQLERLGRLRVALAVARRDPPRVERARAGTWLARELVSPAPGVATVVFHSVVWWYVPESEREAIGAELRSAGARARADAPLAWLRLEGASEKEAELRLTLWPGGAEELLGHAHYHAAWVRWAGADGASAP